MTKDAASDTGTSESTEFLGFKLTHSIPGYAVCIIGIFTCYCLSGVSQELLYKQGDFSYTSFLTLAAKTCPILWGIAITKGQVLFERKASHASHASLGLLTYATMYLSNASLLYLNYPSQNILKGSKVLPVMFVSVCIYHKRYVWKEYASALLLFAGLAVNTYVDSQVDTHFSVLGIVLISLALMADAFIGSEQVRIFDAYQCSATEILVFTNLWAASLSLVTALYLNDFFPALEYLQKQPIAILAICMYSIFNVLGSYFILLSISLFGEFECDSICV
jgi:solute carrier family 35 (adenosine 3'-phospho 5'-phosphosulfate transporter), member B3